MPSARELARRTGTLATLPDVFLQAKRLMDDPRVSLIEVAAVIGRDPGATARMLRIANSAFFGLSYRIDTLARAVTVLGTDQVHDLLLAASVVSAFRGIPPDVIDMRGFWERSIHTGVCARLIAARCNVLDTERVFVEGLLADIGHLVLYTQLPALAKEALVLSRHERVARHRVERELIGFDHAEVGAELLREWKLPAHLCESIEYQLEPSAAATVPLEASIVHLACALTAAAYDDADVAATVDPFAWRMTGVGPEAIAGLQAQALAHTETTIGLVLGGGVRARGAAAR